MTVRVRQVERVTQPQGAVAIDWSNPITKELCVCIDPNGIECVNGIYPSLSGASIGSGVGGKGIVISGGSDDRAYWAAPAFTASDEVSLEFLVSITSAPSLSAIGGLSRYDTFTTINEGETRAVLAFPGSPGDWYWWGANNDHDSGVTIGTSGSLAHYVVTKASGAGSYQVTHYLNGVQIAQGNSSGTKTELDLPIPYFVLGSRHLSGSSSPTMVVYKAGAWRRVLGANEVQSLASNPWQLFEPEQIVVPYYAAAGGPTYTLTAATGSFTLTGQSANLVVSRKLTAATGSFTLTGQSANLVVSRKLVAETGSFSLTGQSANLQVSRKLVADTGTFSLTGIAVNLVYTPVATYTLTAQTGVFNLTGQAAAFKVSRKLVAETGVFYFVGNAANFYPGGVIPTTTKGGVGKGKNLTLKQKKKLKQVVNQEWLKAEQTVQELLLDRLGHAEPAKVKIEKLTASKSLVDVIEALKALSKETVTLPEQQAVIKTINKTIVEKTTKPAEKVSDIEERLAKFEKRLVDIEEMVLVVMSEIM